MSSSQPTNLTNTTQERPSVEHDLLNSFRQFSANEIERERTDRANVSNRPSPPIPPEAVRRAQRPPPPVPHQQQQQRREAALRRHIARSRRFVNLHIPNSDDSDDSDDMHMGNINGHERCSHLSANYRGRGFDTQGRWREHRPCTLCARSNPSAYRHNQRHAYFALNPRYIPMVANMLRRGMRFSAAVTMAQQREQAQRRIRREASWELREVIGLIERQHERLRGRGWPPRVRRLIERSIQEQEVVVEPGEDLPTVMQENNDAGEGGEVDDRGENEGENPD